MDYSPDRRYLVSGSNDGTVRIWDVESNTLMQTLKGHKGWVRSVDYSPDGRYLVSSSSDQTVRIWNVEKNIQMQTLKGHEGGVLSVEYSPDSKYLVSGGSDQTVRIWDVESATLVQALKGHKGVVRSVKYSPDGEYVASSSEDKTVRIWDVESATVVRILKGHEGWVWSVDYSPDGKYIVSGSEDKTVRIWDVESATLVQILEGHKDAVRSVGYSSNGEYIASGSNDGTVRIWDVESATLVQILEGHEGWVRSVDYSPDGKYLVSGGSDETVRIWDLENEILVQTLKEHEGGVRSVKYSPNGKYLVSGSEDKTVRLWLGSDWQDWLALGCDRLRLHSVFVSPQADREATETCLKYGGWSDPEKAEFIARQGLAMAVEKVDLEGAKAKFKQAYKIDPANVNLAELETEANQLAAQTVIERGTNSVEQGNVTEALSLYKQAQKLDPNLEIDARSWNQLCKYGSIYRHAEQVLFACEKAVELAPNDGGYLDSRGLARALTGDRKGASEDFQAYVHSPRKAPSAKSKRQQWIETLKKGENPFTDEVLEDLKNEY